MPAQAQAGTHASLQLLDDSCVDLRLRGDDVGVRLSCPPVHPVQSHSGGEAVYSFSVTSGWPAGSRLAWAVAARMAGTTSSARSTVRKRTSMSGRMKASACMWRMRVRNGA